MRVVFFLTLAALACAQTTPEIDNAWVRVTRVKLAAQEGMPIAEHPDSVFVFLTDAWHKLGDVDYVEAGKYAIWNRSGQPFEAIVTELKPAPTGPAQPRVTLDPVKLDPEHHLVPLENNRVRVLRTILEPHLKSPMHEHPHYVVVYLTELHTTMVLG